MRLISLLLVAVVSKASFAKDIQDQFAVRMECSSAFFFQPDVLACIDRKAKASAKMLSDAEARLSKAMANWDEWDRLKAEAKAALIRSSKAFKQYRTAHCDFMAASIGDAAGSRPEMMLLSCEAELNARRAAQLDQVAADMARLRKK